MARRIKIGGRLESVETGNIVAGANQIIDDAKNKKQSDINGEVDAELVRLDETKQGNLTFDNAPTEDSNNPVKSGGVYAADKLLSDAIEAILLLIPSAASALNKLVDMQTMNSSIATATATFRGTYNVVSDLELAYNATHEQIAAKLDEVITTADNNDYAFVQIPVSATSQDIAKTERYKFNGEAWAYEYDLNNSGFTQAQWDAINSTITAALVSKLSALPTATELQTALNGKQDNLTFDQTPTSGSQNPVTSGGIYARNAEIVALITALDTAKQDVLTFDSTPTQNSSNPVTSNGVYVAVSALQAAIVALDAAKQNVLTFDSTPTLGSNNPVTSSGIKTQLNRIDGDIVTLNNLYQALTQSALVIVQLSDTWPVASPDATTIYRVVDRDHTPPQYYSDYMFSGSTPVLMAQYNNAIDDVPTLGSNNLVSSNGLAETYGYYKESVDFIESKVDSNNRLIEGIKKDGTREQYGDVNLFGKVSSDVVACYKELSPEYIIAILDRKERILLGLDKDGLLAVNGGIKTPKIYTNELSLSKEGQSKLLGNLGVNNKMFYWGGKTVVWYGTSIPAGSSQQVSFNGNPVKARLSYTDELVAYNGESIANQYPVMVGSLLGAELVYNEALGSSCAAERTSSGDLLFLCKGMGNTVTKICTWLTGCYNIDWNNKTFSRNTENPYGVTVFLNDGSWNDLMASFYDCVRMSYQISLVSRYLISDSAQHSAYITEIFGGFLSNFQLGFESAGYSLSEMTAYRGQTDIFVFDHGHNEPYFSTPDSESMTTYEGAMNKYISLIYRYKPNARVIIVSDYTNYVQDLDTIKHQQDLAERWQIPFANVSKVLPVSKKCKVLTCGYWNNGVWNNSGFTYSVSGGSYETNNTFEAMLLNLGYDNTLQNVQDVFEPEQIDGVWYWNAYPLCIWMADAVHPHSDKEGRLTKLYARFLASYIEKL